MRHQIGRVLGALLALVVVLPCVSAPAVAATSGGETMAGFVVSSGQSGTRTAISTAIVARGVFNGVGRIVEIPDLPTDPGNVSRDVLVFAAGTLRIVTENSGLSIAMNPRTCVFAASAQQKTTIESGTGRFSTATGRFAGSVKAYGLAARDPMAAAPGSETRCSSSTR